MNDPQVERDAVVSQLQRVLASAPFQQSERSSGLLRYLVDRALSGSGDRLKEYTVGAEALGRGTAFDPRTDPIVRAEASRLRGRLESYYAHAGKFDPVVIALPKGTYTPNFVRNSAVDHEPTVVTSINRPAHLQRLPMLWAALGVTFVIGAIGGSAWHMRSSSVAPEPSMQFEVQLQSDELVGSDVGTDVVISPDGLRVVFVSKDSLGIAHLRVRRLDGSPPLDLPGTSGVRGPFWSPDSKWIGFWAARQLRKVAVDGGSPVVLCDAADLLGASWSDNGMIIAALDATSRLWRVDGSIGGTPTVAVDMSADSAAPRWPQVLPDGNHILFTAIVGVGVDRANVEIASLKDGKRQTLIEGATFARYVAPNHLVFVNQGTLFAVKFDPARREIRGPKVPIINDVSYSSAFGFAQISIANGGRAMYRRSMPMIVARIDSAGRQTPILETPGIYGWPSLSPDGTQLAVAVVESGVPSLSMFTNLHAKPRLAWNKSGLDAAVWTRDGQYLVAHAIQGIVQVDATSGKSRRLVDSPHISVPWSVAPGDDRLYYSVMDSATAFDVWSIPMRKWNDSLSAGKAMAVVQSRDFETYPAISPDGQWLAYASNVAGPTEIIVRSLRDTNFSIPVARGRVPRWSRTGTHLFFTAPDQQLMIVGYSLANGKLVTDAPRRWTSRGFADTGVLPNYDLGADGHSIVALLPARPHEVQAPNHVTLIQDLSAQLRQKMP